MIYKIPDGGTKYVQRLCLQCQQTSHTSTSCNSRIPGEHKMRYGVWRPNACRVSFLFEYKLVVYICESNDSNNREILEKGKTRNKVVFILYGYLENMDEALGLIVYRSVCLFTMRALMTYSDGMEWATLVI